MMISVEITYLIKLILFVVLVVICEAKRTLSANNIIYVITIYIIFPMYIFYTSIKHFLKLIDFLIMLRHTNVFTRQKWHTE